MNARSTEISSHGNRTGKAKTATGLVLHFEIVGEVSELVGAQKNKKLVFQQIRFTDGREQIRIGYYVMGQKGDMIDRWVWGRNAPLMDVKELASLLKQANAKGWL